MTSIAETLRAIEARAERAIVQELRLMTQDILAVRTSLVLQDRNQADALLMKLDRLAENLTVAPVSVTDTSALLMPDLCLDEVQVLVPVVYKVFFYGRACGDLEDVVTRETFAAGVQLVLDRLDAHRGHVIEASWTNGRGAFKILTPSGATLATVEAVDAVDVVVDPIVNKVCQALQLGDTSRIEQLFGLMLKAA